MPSKASNIKCFKCLDKGHITSQCPNRRLMIVKDDGEIKSKSSIGEVSTCSESLSDGSHYEGDLLVLRRFMNNHVGEEAETQRENIFHSKCLILGNLCSTIIDGGSNVNVYQCSLIALPTIVHSRPYRLQWLSENGELLVDKQAEVIFTLSAYKDRIVCDIIHGVTNRFNFIHLGQRVMLKPLSLREVQENQKKMKGRSDAEKKKEKGKEKVGEKSKSVMGKNKKNERLKKPHLSGKSKKKKKKRKKEKNPC
ncbi:hypothetical protein CR513_57243, partial [Mucuna pruriens]